MQVRVEGNEPEINEAKIMAELLSLGQQVSAVLAENAPSDFGTLHTLLGRSVEILGPMAVGVGSYDDLGASPDDSAPRGTLRAFFNDHPNVRPSNWWGMSRESREQLAEGRRSGRYGGIPGKAPYWHIQEVGNSTAGITGQRYIERTDVLVDRMADETNRRL